MNLLLLLSMLLLAFLFGRCARLEFRHSDPVAPPTPARWQVTYSNGCSCEYRDDVPGRLAIAYSVLSHFPKSQRPCA